MFAVLLLFADPLLHSFPREVAGSYAQVTKGQPCMMAIQGDGAYELRCGNRPVRRGRMTQMGSFLIPHVDPDEWAQYQAAANAHIARERQVHGYVPILEAPPRIDEAFLFTAVVLDGSTYLVDLQLRSNFCSGKDGVTAVEAAGGGTGRIFRKLTKASATYGISFDDYCAPQWQPTL